MKYLNRKSQFHQPQIKDKLRTFKIANKDIADENKNESIVPLFIEEKKEENKSGLTEKKEDSKGGLRKKKNNIKENKSIMNTAEKIAIANEILSGNKGDNFKIIKKDKGLIERTESSKTILTEDNKELLID